VTASMRLVCAEHLGRWSPWCDGCVSYPVDTADAARALADAERPGSAAGASARVVVRCDVGGCLTLMMVPAETVEEGRALVARHNYGWYTLRLAGGRIADGCQWHLGSCCIHHARPGSPTLDPRAILPAAEQEAAPVQLDLLAAAGGF
jgi:hypothetical protein